jgi:pimeloyl-ACP methyl ester carboxylesterase
MVLPVSRGRTIRPGSHSLLRNRDGTMPYYQSAGIRLHYEDHGAGEPLILLHGFGQDGSAWIDPLPAYARFFRVLVMDMRGCGRSEVTEPGYSPKDLAGDVVALMDHIGADKAHFAGFSLGGAVGLELGIAHSDRLMSLSLHSTWEGGPCPHMKRWIEVRRRIIEIGDPLVKRRYACRQLLQSRIRQ